MSVLYRKPFTLTTQGRCQFCNIGTSIPNYNRLGGWPLQFLRTGHYNRSDGNLALRTTVGHWWADTAGPATYGRALYTYTGYVYAQYNYWRGYGFALRGVALTYFDELTDKTYSLGEMEAAQIELLTDLSLTAKLLLSAVAGAIIQHLLDQGIPATEIFANGVFAIL